MKVPLSINPCPIIDCSVEIRFVPDVPLNAVFGMIYSKLSSICAEPESLPILQIPENLRQIDPNFKFKPYYKMNTRKGMIIQIGPDVLLFGVSGDYPGWLDFSKELDLVITKIVDSKVVKAISRIGMRYINLFDSDIFDNINLRIDLETIEFPRVQTQFRTQFQSNEFTSTVQISNQVAFSNNPSKGSTLDIDTFILIVDQIKSERNLKAQLMKFLKGIHDAEKEVFFKLLKAEFVANLNPKY